MADSSLKYDLETKTLAYAKAGISEYWVLDVLDRKLHVFQQPRELGYQSQTILAGTLDVTPLAFPDCVVSIRFTHYHRRLHAHQEMKSIL